MVHKCANTSCSASFHNLHEGKVFVMEVENPARPGRYPLLPHYSWLCNSCRRTMTVIAENGKIKVAQLAAFSAGAGA